MIKKLFLFFHYHPKKSFVTERVFKRDFKWPFMQKGKFPLYNGTLETFDLYSEKYCRFSVYLILIFPLLFLQQEYATHFCKEITIENNQRFQNDEYWYLIHTWSGNCCESDIAIFSWRLEGHLKLRVQSLEIELMQNFFLRKSACFTFIKKMEKSKLTKNLLFKYFFEYFFYFRSKGGLSHHMEVHKGLTDCPICGKVQSKVHQLFFFKGSSPPILKIYLFHHYIGKVSFNRVEMFCFLAKKCILSEEKYH